MFEIKRSYRKYVDDKYISIFLINKIYKYKYSFSQIRRKYHFSTARLIKFRIF